jgi:hypothetical protein
MKVTLTDTYEIKGAFKKLEWKRKAATKETSKINT